MNPGDPLQLGKVSAGIVLSVNGTSPGPASGISYEVQVMDEGGVYTATLVPENRYPDEVNIVALEVGTPCVVVQIIDRARMAGVTERPDINICEDA